MKLHNKIEIEEFLAAVDKCKGGVYLRSTKGDSYNLKSELCKYVAIAELIRDEHGKLELFCDRWEDEQYFYEFFSKNPDTL